MSVPIVIPSAFCLQLVSRRGLSQLPLLPKVHVMIIVVDLSEKKNSFNAFALKIFEKIN